MAWYKESKRHSLASRGIKTRQNISYAQLKKLRPRTSPTGDLDKDGIPNALDKKPLKFSKQDELLLEKLSDVDNVAINLTGDFYNYLDRNQKRLVDGWMEIGDFYRFLILRGKSRVDAVRFTAGRFNISKKEWETFTHKINKK